MYQTILCIVDSVYSMGCNVMIRWVKEHWPILPFIGFVLLFIGMMTLEYYEGNCRIGKDMGICGILWDYRTL